MRVCFAVGPSFISLAVALLVPANESFNDAGHYSISIECVPQHISKTLGESGTSELSTICKNCIVSELQCSIT